MKTQFKQTIHLTAAACLFGAWAVSNAWAAPPPSPDSDPNCGGNCQAICINGCDTKAVYLGPDILGVGGWGYYVYAYSGNQFRCVREVVGGLGEPNLSFDSKGYMYYNDGYDCDFGPCGRDGERLCSILAVTYQCYFGTVPGSDLKCHAGPNSPHLKIPQLNPSILAGNSAAPDAASTPSAPKPASATKLPAKLPALASASLSPTKQGDHK